MIAHHSFPNIYGKDPDLYHAPKLIRHSKDIRLKRPHLYQMFTFIITFIIGVPAGMLANSVYQSNKRPSFNRVVPWGKSRYMDGADTNYRYLLQFLLVHIGPFFLHGLTLKGLIFSVVPMYLLSIQFMICSQINHLVPEAVDQFDKNFFIH